MKISFGSLLLVTTLLLLPVRVYEQPSFRTITIDTSEVTTPAVAVTPDGRTLVFSAIGHLFELPVAGGATTQLTFGPSYDFDSGPVARWQSHRVRLEPRRERVEHLRAGSCEQAPHADLTRGRSGQTGMES